MGDMDLLRMQAVLHYVYPLFVFLYFVVTSSIVTCTFKAPGAPKTVHARHRTIWYLLLLFTASFGGQVILKVIEILSWGRWPSQDTILGLLSCILVFGIEQTSLSDASTVTWYPFYGSWLIALFFEPYNAVLLFIGAHKAESGRPVSQPSNSAPLFLQVDASLAIARFVLVLAVLLAYFIWRPRAGTEGSDEERSPLIPKLGQTSSDAEGSTDSGYGTNSDVTNTEANNTDTVNSPTDPESPWERRERETREKIEERLKDEGGWIGYVKGFKIFFPYVWPVHNHRLQFHAALVGLCLLAKNGLNFLIPRQYGAVMDALSNVSGENPWVQVLIFAGLRLLSSEAGIPLLQNLLWLPVEFYAQQALTTAAYAHVMNLSSEFHDTKSSSDLMVAINNGHSISELLESVCFQAIPMMIDLVVAFTYLSVKFGPYEGFITIATGLAFVQAAARLISSFKEQRKKMVKTYYEEHYACQAGIQGWHTVSAFNQVPYEENRYSGAVVSKVTALKTLYSGYAIGHAFQYLILLAGLLAGAFLAVYQITHGQATAGDFVMLLTYWGQLTGPLRFFSQLGRSISNDLVHAEQLLEIMRTKPTVVDKPDARPLRLKGGKVEFRNVNFSYDKKKDILKGVKLSAPQGSTVAFVGSTGAGKSTILKLLDRFYDVTGGSILIDGQDIRDVTIASLRQAIGIVPQSPILFDDTVINNIRYARLSASDEDVYSACKAAAIHDQIMGFTEGYSTRVGERGVKLSGGELQRIAIARAILKRPEIVLLDEATSSVDTDTEQKIQEGLRVLCQGRTTFIVAHRLSTVMNADIIFVVSEGGVVEQGSHEDLIAKNGKYAELWSKQVFVKAKNAKEEEECTELVQPQPLPNTQTDGSLDEPPNEASTSSTVQQESTPKTAAVTVDDKADGQAVNTPTGHKKEGSKLNPGAPEFTPRSLAMSKPLPSSPIRNSWAEDVEEEITSPNKAPAVDMESASFSTVVKAYESHTPPQPEEINAPVDLCDVTTVQPTTPEGREFRPRRNTLQSVSCPDAPLLSFQNSPARSVSQPVPPTPPVPQSTPVEPAAVPAIRPELAQENQKPGEIKPAATEARPPHGPPQGPPQGPARGRGSYRGRNNRGRYRGRGRRNGTNPRPSQGVNGGGVPLSGGSQTTAGPR